VVVAAPIDQVRTLYRTLLVYAAVSILILLAGLAEFAYFEPSGQHTGIKATIVGVYQYDPNTGQLTGPDSVTFPRTVQFAAECGSRHLSALPGIHFENETEADSFRRCCDELAWRCSLAKEHGLVFSVEAHVGSIAPVQTEREGSGTSSAGSKSWRTPNPSHFGHIPCGLLKLKSCGLGGSKLSPQKPQA